MKPWVLYTVARLGLFLASLAILLLVGTGWVMGAIFATAISLALSVLFLGSVRQRVADSLKDRVTQPKKDADSETEDAQLNKSAG
ncbi:MAG: DUF4229 domain-containing protein [Microbacteriaceae bacterium]